MCVLPLMGMESLLQQWRNFSKQKRATNGSSFLFLEKCGRAKKLAMYSRIRHLL
jgi:hypothetical protein